MRILLDENFPLALHRVLAEGGREVDHVILLGLRGCSDSELLDRLEREDLLFLTQDTEFLSIPPESARNRRRVAGEAGTADSRQGPPLGEGSRPILRDEATGKLFEIDDSGDLGPWKSFPTIEPPDSTT